MSFFEDFQKSLGTIEDLNTVHNFYRFVCTGRIISLNQNLADELKKLFEIIKNLNIPLNLSITVEGYGPQRFSVASLEKFDERATTLRSNFSTDNEVNFQLESVGWTNLNIFDISSFTEFLKKEPLDKTLKAYNKYFINKSLIVNIFDHHEVVLNQFFYIQSVYPNINTDGMEEWKRKYNRENILQEKIECRDKVGHFVNADQYGFIPEFFDFKEKFFLAEHFKYLRSVFNLIFLSDHSNIIENSLSFKIKGYKTLNCKLHDRLPIDVEDEITSLYEWVYSDGPFVDKMGIARNVISIHIKDENISTLEKGTCHSAQSGYDLYSRDNVKQYIEVKNKIADVLYTQSEKASGIVKDMFTMFRTSMWTFLSFFLMSFLVKVIERKTELTTLHEILNFNLTTSVIGFLLIIISIFYLFFARKEVADETKRLDNKYLEIENRYKDLLNEKDLQKILTQSNVNGRSAQEIEIAYINEKKSLYTQYWILIIVVLFGILLIPYYDIIGAFLANIIS